MARQPAALLAPRTLMENPMPFIHIRSLPFDKPLKPAAVLTGLSEDFAAATGIALRHVTATWSFIEPGHYAAGGVTARSQPAATHPLLVDVLAPDFSPPQAIEGMLETIATSLAKRARLPRENIFIHYRQAHSGMVFDAGQVVRW